MKDTIENSSFYSRPQTYSIIVKNDNGEDEEKIFDNEAAGYKGLDLLLGWYSQYFMEDKKFTKAQLKNKRKWEERFTQYFKLIPDVQDYLKARYNTFAAQLLEDEIVMYRGRNSILADCLATDSCLNLYEDYLLNPVPPTFDDEPENTKE